MGSEKKKPEKKKDPFEGMGFVGVFGLPLARYAYEHAEQAEKPKPKKTGKDEVYI